MKFGITRWNFDPVYPLPLSLASQSCRKFSAVLGTTSSNNSKLMRPVCSAFQVSLAFASIKQLQAYETISIFSLSQLLIANQALTNISGVHLCHCTILINIYLWTLPIAVKVALDNH